MALKEKIDSKQLILCGEISPPQSCDGDVIREKARYFKGLVDAVNITDNQTAIARLSSIASAKILLDEGVEPIMQMTCRDRNRLAMQSDLLGAAALGLRNLLCVTGDYPTFGDQPEAKGVFDLDSIQLIAAASHMNQGLLLSGHEMKKAPDFLIGAAANPCGQPMEMRLIRLHKKIQAGARFIQTQAVFDLELFSRWLQQAVAWGLTEKAVILAGVLPLKSVKAVRHMQQVPGVRIDEGYVHRMQQANDPQEEGVKIAVEIIHALVRMKGVAGIHLMPVMWESITPILLREAGWTTLNQGERP
ncbi:MAG TPA: methylenetetrahydrofolate reductase [bacterium]|nr:methylenetetrahydrofolate reductase [bacterium]